MIFDFEIEIEARRQKLGPIAHSREERDGSGAKYGESGDIGRDRPDRSKRVWPERLTR